MRGRGVSGTSVRLVIGLLALNFIRVTRPSGLVTAVWVIGPAPEVGEEGFQSSVRGQGRAPLCTARARCAAVTCDSSNFGCNLTI